MVNSFGKPTIYLGVGSSLEGIARFYYLPKTAEGFVLELSYPFPADTQAFSDSVESFWSGPVETKATLKDH